MGIVESWYICVYNLRWNTQEFRGTYLESKVGEFRRMDPGTSQSKEEI